MLISDNSPSPAVADARKRPVQERSRRTVEAILDAAAQLLATNGYQATTTNHVAERAGVSIGSLYQYFPNKDALLVALEDRHLDEVEAALRELSRQWRQTDPEPTGFATSFVRTLVAVNSSDLHRVIYNSAPPLARVQERVRTI
nr:helix-turn-helix domain-containing protein [Micromonospora sp. DSM 115978]